MKIKICGIKNEAEVKIINETKPDFAGFIFAPSKRFVDFEYAKKICAKVNPEIKKVGVFVEKTANEILNYKNIVDIIQLHGDYTENDVECLKKEGFEVIKVIKVKEEIYNIETKADYLLFDTYSPFVSGGLGKTFNWDIKIKTKTPYFIAGGINQENIIKMYEKFKPYGADVSSGAEENGFKTKEKVSCIINTVRRINL